MAHLSTTRRMQRFVHYLVLECIRRIRAQRPHWVIE